MGTNRFRNAARRARTHTNNQLAEEMTSRFQFTKEHLKELLPESRDQEEFISLMKEVQAETSMDLKMAKLRNNFTTVGKLALSLAKGIV